MPVNLFLKHLIILADYGGELIKRLGREFNSVFPINQTTNRHVMHYVFRTQQQLYEFQSLPVNGLGNAKLHIDGVSIIKSYNLTPLYQDIIMILLHGAASDVAHLASLERCEVGMLLGDDVAIDRYVKEKYLHVSRITMGANANSLGQIAQTYVYDILYNSLPRKYKITRNGLIYLSGYDKLGGMPFDVVIENNGNKIGLEVTFQVTTNSVIERKSGQAKNRQNLMHENGYFIAYVIDGAGNFQRTTAVSTICDFSDCTVAYSESEIAVLANYIQEKFNA